METSQNRHTTIIRPIVRVAAEDTRQSAELAVPRRIGLSATTVHILAFMVILALAGGLRVVHLNAVGYNSDEAVYAGQGAAIAQAPILTDIFPVFRAHPLLFQFLLAVAFKAGVYDWLGRLVSVGVGLITVVVLYWLGNRLYGRQAGLYAMLLMAVMPYHVVVTRQVLLDGSMALAASLTLLLLARFAETERASWLIAAGAGMGLTFLSKETGILMVGAIYAFLALSPEIRIRIRDIILSVVAMVVVMSPFPLSISLSGASSGKTAESYLVWQLFRRPNHEWDFYLTMVPPAIGILVIVAAVAGIWLLRRQNSWREKLLITWIIMPIAFFQLWPTKGYQYLLPIATPMALLAARTLVHWPPGHIRFRRWQIPQYLPGLVAAIIMAVTLIIPSWELIHPPQSDTFLAGSGGIPGGRELGQWIQNNAPDGALFMTIGPSMANIIKFYGHRDAYGLSVSPNPLRRNPSYEPILNPDFQIRTGEVQYVVWDSFSAARSTFFSEKLLWYTERYHGRVVHTESVQITTPDGGTIEKPVIVVYEVHP